VILRHDHRKPSLRLLSMHQYIWDPHFQHNMLLSRSPTCFRNWTLTSVSLKRKAKNSLHAKPFAPRVELPYVVAGTIGVELSQRWNEKITEVTRSAAIAGRHVEKCVESGRREGTQQWTRTHRHTHTYKSCYSVVSRKDEKM